MGNEHSSGDLNPKFSAGRREPQEVRYKTLSATTWLCSRADDTLEVQVCVQASWVHGVPVSYLADRGQSRARSETQRSSVSCLV